MEDKGGTSVKAVLLGYGTVGKGVEALAKQTDGLEIKNVFVLPEFEDLPYFTSDGTACVTDPEVDIVFECLSGTEPSNTLITEALKHGKHVITSNKATVSPNLERYVKLAEENGGSIQIEASVAGGIPFLDAILKLQKLEDLTGYEGIFNGTGNYILDQMQKNGTDFDTALKDAQAKGYAEANPEADTEGWDVFYKSNITNMLAYGTKNDGIPNPIGISHVTPEDIEMAKKHGRAIRHLSRSKQADGKYATVIAPVFLEAGDYLANVPDNYNAQMIYAPSFEKLGYFGQGAGRMATAQAMLANALDTMAGTERAIRLDQEKKHDPNLILSDWIVRSEKDLTGFEPDEMLDGYYCFRQRPADFGRQVADFAPEAMIALWA